MLEIQGDISVGEMQALYEALDRSGVQIEDFKVDANKGIIEIKTDIDVTEKHFLMGIKDLDKWEQIKGKVSGIVSESVLDKAREFVLKNGLKTSTLSVGGTYFLMEEGFYDGVTVSPIIILGVVAGIVGFFWLVSEGKL